MENKIDYFGQSNFDLKKYLFKLIANWYLFIFSIIIAYIIVVIKNQYVIPFYGVHATILVKDPNSPQRYLQGFNFFDANTNIQNEINILKQQFITQYAVNELNFRVTYFKKEQFISPELYKKSPFFVELDSSFAQSENEVMQITILSENEYHLENEKFRINSILNFGEQFEHPYYNFKIRLNNQYYTNEVINQPYYFIVNNLSAIAINYSKRLNVEQYMSSGSVLWLWIDGPVPAKDADFLNKLIEVYTRIGLEEKNQIAVNTIRFIDEQLKGISDSLTVAASSLQDFRLENNIVDLSKEGETLFEQLKLLQSEKTIKRINLNYYNYLLKELESNGDLSEIVSPDIMGITDQAVNEHIKVLMSLFEEKKIKYLGVKNLKNIPSYKMLDFKIVNAKNNLLKAIKINISVIKNAFREIDSTLTDVNSRIQGLPVTERQLAAIDQKYKFNDNIYNYLLEKRTEAAISRAATVPDTKVLDKAVAETAVPRPSTETNPLIAIILGFLFPFVIIFAKDFFNDKIEDRTDIEHITKIPVIGTIGHHNNESKFIVYDKPKSQISESFRILRTNLQYLLVEQQNGIIAICSSISGEGKTFCSLNLASIIAMSNKKTIIIGLDLRKPKLHGMFGLENEKGMSTYLIGKHTVDEVVQHTHIENLDIIISGPIPPNPAEIIGTNRMKEILEYLRTVYEFVIIDTSPVAVVTDALLISPLIDTTIFVVRLNYSTKHFLKYLNELYETQKIFPASIIVNDVKAASIYGYRYSYTYRYGYGYGYSYGKGYYTQEAKLTYKEKLKKLFTFKRKNTV